MLNALLKNVCVFLLMIARRFKNDSAMAPMVYHEAIYKVDINIHTDKLFANEFV